MSPSPDVVRTVPEKNLRGRGVDGNGFCPQGGGVLEFGFRLRLLMSMSSVSGWWRRK